jgi:hypothetical protein
MSEVSELRPSGSAEYLPGPRVISLPTRRGPELASLTDVRREMSKVYRQAKSGRIRTEDASRYTFMLASIGKVLEVCDLEKRLEQLEAARGIHS